MAKQTIEDIQKEFDQFVYVVSHDLGAPVRSMSGYASLLENKYADQLDEEGKLFLNNIIKGSKSFQGLMDGLLAYSRLNTKLNIIKNVNLNEVLNEVEEALSKQIAESGTKIKCETLPVITCDENQIYMCFKHLIHNAIKFHKPNKKPQIDITLKEQDNSCKICFADNGIGIDQKHFDQIFVIFRKLHLDSEYPGNGVGLSLCKKIMQLHDGKIKVESKLDSGSKFYITFPRI